MDGWPGQDTLRGGESELGSSPVILQTVRPSERETRRSGARSSWERTCTYASHRLSGDDCPSWEDAERCIVR